MAIDNESFMENMKSIAYQVLHPENDSHFGRD